MNIGNPIIKEKRMNEDQEWWFPSRDSYDEERAVALLDLLEMEMVAADATTPRSRDSVIEYCDGTVLYFGWGRMKMTKFGICFTNSAVMGST